MTAFLAAIGIEMRPGGGGVATLFPGSLIDRGALVIDETRGMAFDEQNATLCGVPPFPHMVRWLRESE
jgi:hypothetical protein